MNAKLTGSPGCSWDNGGYHRNLHFASARCAGMDMEVRLCGEIAPGWMIFQQLLVTLERDEDGYYIVSDDQFAIYGDGDTPVKALEDYIESLIDYYQLLAVRADSDPPTEALFCRLRSYLRPIVE